MHKTTVRVVKEAVPTFLPVCGCGWQGFATIFRNFPRSANDLLTGGRTAATAQLKEHLLDPYSSGGFPKVIEKVA